MEAASSLPSKRGFESAFETVPISSSVSVETDLEVLPFSEFEAVMEGLGMSLGRRDVVSLGCGELMVLGSGV